MATRCSRAAPPATLVALATFDAFTTFVFLMERTGFFFPDLSTARTVPDRFPAADVRVFEPFFPAAVFPALFFLLPVWFFLLPFTLRSPVTPVLFLTFDTSSPRLLQQTLHEFGILSVS